MKTKNQQVYNKKLQMAKKYYKLNREKKIKYVGEYRKKNAEIIQVKRKIKYLKNREKILQKQKRYYIENARLISIKGKLYRKINAEKIKVKNRNRKNLIRSLSKKSDINNEYLEIIIKNSVKCPICGNKYKSKSDKHIDHIIPLNIGGKHTKSNIRIICSHCNLTRPKDGRDICK